MTDKKDIFREEQDVIKETDIVFDCPHCDKSLAIDYRGAGLTIQCSDCGQDVEVPIPEGMELTDIDSSEAEQEMQILNLRRSLAISEHKVQELQNDLIELTERRSTLEKSRTSNLNVYGKITDELDHIENALQDISKALGSIRDVIKNDGNSVMF
ncbi:hypothetical protein BVX97_04485 [bacterium E08(2017)]|nr:hypothetical protein BVX97_04485 [bacterium E08(2017)]